MNKEKKLTVEGKTLRYMRMTRGLSQRTVAKNCNLSSASIGHFEHGRVDLTESRIAEFLNLYGYTQEEFEEYKRGKPIPTLDLKYECLLLLEKIDEAKLRTVHAVLMGFVRG